MRSRNLHEQVKKPRNKYLETRSEKYWKRKIYVFSVKKDKKQYYLTLNEKKLHRQFEFLAYHTNNTSRQTCY